MFDRFLNTPLFLVYFYSLRVSFFALGYIKVGYKGMCEHISIFHEKRGASHCHLLKFRLIYYEKFSLKGCCDTWKMFAMMEEKTIDRMMIYSKLYILLALLFFGCLKKMYSVALIH